MDVYTAISPPDTYFRIDDLLDFSHDEPLPSSSSSGAHHHHHPPPENPSFLHLHPSSSSSAPSAPSLSTDFTDNLSVPSDDVAELEWLSQFVDDSFCDYPANSLVGTINVPPDTSFSGRARSKRSRGVPANTPSTTAAAAAAASWTTSSCPEAESLASGKSKSKKETTSRASSPMAEGGVRRCTHCASEKTPQWRTGPLGPKTLCNACGVRYKSGRLVPEYRPAASPTFVLTQHSNSHRKVLELRRQKEMLRQQQEQNHHHHQQQQQQRIYHHHHHHHHQDFEVC